MGIDKEFGLSSLTVPSSLFYGRRKRPTHADTSGCVFSVVVVVIASTLMLVAPKKMRSIILHHPLSSHSIRAPFLHTFLLYCTHSTRLGWSLERVYPKTSPSTTLVAKLAPWAKSYIKTRRTTTRQQRKSATEKGMESQWRRRSSRKRPCRCSVIRVSMKR